MSEMDEIEQALAGTVRVAMSAAARVGDAFAQVRRHQMENKARLAQVEREQFEQRWTAESTAARAAYGPTADASWWDQANPADVANAYMLARGWKDADPMAEAAEKHMAAQIKDRYGVDVTEGADGTAAGERLKAYTDQVSQGTEYAPKDALQWLIRGDEVDRIRLSGVQPHIDPQVMKVLEDRGRYPTEQEWQTLETARAAGVATDRELAFLDERDRRKKAAETTGATLAAGQAADATEAKASDRAETKGEAAAPEYDSHERREATAERMRAEGVDESAVQAAMLADASQGRPASEVGTGKSKVAARPSRGQVPGQAQQAEISR